MKKGLKRKSKKNGMLIIYILLISVVFLTAGYAILTQTINAGGTATADADFAIVWQSPSITSSNGATATAVPTLSNGNATLTINPVLEYPGAYVEVTSTVANTGNIDAAITGLTTTNPVGTDITVTYTPSFAVAQTLAAGATKQVVIRITYNAASTNQNPISEAFGITVTYTQDTN